eukprot:gene27876-31491_t
MARRFRLWEANGAIPVSSCESPARSTAVTSSHSSSFMSISEASDRKNAPYAKYDSFALTGTIFADEEGSRRQGNQLDTPLGLLLRG